jgi:uncharacterized membrane protein YkgB
MKSTTNYRLTRLSKWVQENNIPFFILAGGMVVMLYWAGTFKMTHAGADTITSLVTNSPLLSWHFRVFGPDLGSIIIGSTEVTAASLIIAGLFNPNLGMIGSCIAILMFFLTSTMLFSTPGLLVNVKGTYFLDLLGLFLFKDIISLGASFYLLTYFGGKAIKRDSRIWTK